MMNNSYLQSLKPVHTAYCGGVACTIWPKICLGHET